MPMSVAKASFNMTGLFEAELLVELMLRYWKHPRATDREFRTELLEHAAEALRAALAGEELILGLPPKSLNLVAAVWYVEWHSLTADPQKLTSIRKRWKKWLEAVRRAVPSCFCNPDLLG
jgi:hypothetical protein